MGERSVAVVGHTGGHPAVGVPVLEPVPVQQLAEGGVGGAFFMVESNRQQLVELAKLIDAGTVRPIVSEVLPLEAAARAYFPSTRTKPGKQVLQVSTQ